MVDGPATRSSANLKSFLTNEDNKRQLCQFLLCGEVEAASLLEKSGTAER